MMTQIIGLALSLALTSPTAVVQEALEPLSVWAVHENAFYYDEREIVVSGYVVDSHTEWYGNSGSDYMTWNLVISDDLYPDEQSHVLLCYESGFNIDRIRECAEIADIQKELERQITVVGEYDAEKTIVNLRKFLYFEEGEPQELDTDVGDHERVRIYTSYHQDFDYDIHYVVWYRHSHIWPHPIWWLWWEPIYVVRPPTRYVVYYTPWRTYRRRVHPIRVRPRVRSVVRHDDRIRVSPRRGHEVTETRRVRTDPRVSRERVRAPSLRETDRSRTETQRVRVRSERSSPPQRTRSAEQRRVAPEGQQNSTVRHAPAPAPSRVRSTPRTRSDGRPSSSVHQPTRISSSRSASVGTRSTSRRR